MAAPAASSVTIVPMNPTPRRRRLFKDPLGPLAHGAAVAYAVGGYLAGWAGLFHASAWVYLPATVLLAHAMVIAAYLVHECAHNTVFLDNRANARLGGALAWLCGACHGTYEAIRYKHFRHHVDNDDVVWFDYEAWFRRHPRVLALTRALEWAYLPAHEIVMHALLAVNAFVIPERRDERPRNAVILAVRVGLWLVVAAISPRAALLYLLAYLLMLVVLRFMDSLQHDYDYHLTLYDRRPSPRRGDAVFEQAHTFSNPLSLRHPWLNVLVLNFGYHNAHHARPATPWFRLPALHRQMTGDDPARVIPLASQLAIYHRGRVARIVKWDDAQALPEGEAFLVAARAAAVPGGNAASFLTSF